MMTFSGLNTVMNNVEDKDGDQQKHQQHNLLKQNQQEEIQLIIPIALQFTLNAIIKEM